MPKIMTYIGLGTSGLIALIFTLDIALGLPFKRASPTMDIAMIVVAAIMAYMSWTTMKEQV